MKRSNIDQYICACEALPAVTREGLAALQLEKLNAMLARVRERGGAYRDYPQALDSLEELGQLPFTTARQLGEHPGSYLVSSQADVRRVISGATSGTTGAAKRVFYTETDLERTVMLYESGIGEMLEPGQKCLICFPFTGPFGLGDLIARAVESLGAIPVRGGWGMTWGELNAHIRREQPQCYIGFPVGLLSALRLYGGDFPIRRALVSGDACPAGVMEALEKALGSRLYPHYGSREGGMAGAITCPAFRGMHLRENHILAEIVDEGGNVLPEGEYGELVITTLGMEAMPLIRYRTGDYTRFLPPCPCGSCTRRIDRVTRREEEGMERLDSALFALAPLVDCRARFDGQLHIHARVLGPCPLEETAQALFPGTKIHIQREPASPNHRPLYPGKRYMDR